MHANRNSGLICFFAGRAYLAGVFSSIMLQTRYFFGYSYYYATA